MSLFRERAVWLCGSAVVCSRMGALVSEKSPLSRRNQHVFPLIVINRTARRRMIETELTK